MLDASKVEEVCRAVDFVFCAVNMPKPETKALEIALAKTETPVVSNNSAQRGEPDVPMMMPEVNIDHAKVIDTQRKRLGTKRGFVSVKPNCSIQSYVPRPVSCWILASSRFQYVAIIRPFPGPGKPLRPGLKW